MGREAEMLYGKGKFSVFFLEGTCSGVAGGANVDRLFHARGADTPNARSPNFSLFIVILSRKT